MISPKAQKMASGEWRVRLRIGGTERLVYGKTKYQAEREALAIKAKYTVTKAVYTPVTGTLEAAYDEYIAAKEGVLSPSTVAGYKRLKEHSFQSIMRLPVASITNAAIQREVTNMAKAGKSRKTIANAVGLLGAVLGLSNPDFNVRVTLPPQPHIERIEPKESDIEAIMRAVHGYSVELPTLLAMCLGLRMSEILGLTWDCVDGDRLHIRQARVDEGVKGTKTYAGTRTLIMPPFIRELFDKRPHTGDLVFTYSRRTIYENFQKYTKRAGIQHYRFHDLRHLNTTVQLLMGIDNKTITKRNGWSTDAMIRAVYGHTSDERQDLATEVVNDYFGTKMAQATSQTL